jgi:hypothetical protein
MALFTAIATAIGTAIGLTGTALTIFTAVGATVLSIGASTLIAKRVARQGSGGTAGGGRVQLPPATDNKIPVVYGSALIGGPITDAKISVDQKYMWYVVALAEHTDTTAGSGYTFDQTSIYYEGKKVQFGSNGRVTGLINNSPGGTEIDTKVDGKIYIWLFTNGSNSGVNTGGQTAIQILSDSSTGGGIPVGYQWTSTDTMTNCCFAIVRVEYSENAGTTNLGGLLCSISNTINKPGDAILDYMLNTRYGCAIPLSRIDTTSLTALNTYSDEIITYTGGTQERYRINGPINTSSTCLENLQVLVDSCDSWLQYSELSAQWRVVINQSYTDYTTIDNLFLVDSSNLIGGINVAPINLNETYNEMEVAYPNQYIKDQTDYQVILLEDYQPGLLSPNEAVNRLNIDYPVVNNAVQAKYLGIRRLLQSREDLTVTFRLDYSGIQVEAGDVIRIKQEVYGWDVLNTGKGKLFRVANVAEEKYADGSLGVSIAAFEYNDTVYADQAITDFQPDPNLGISDPNIISAPDAPQILINDLGTIDTFQVFGNVPDIGLVTNLNFNYGTDSNVSNHTFYTTINNSNGAPLTNSDSANSVYNTYTVDVSTLPTGNYYWSVVARNQTAGISSNASNVVNWGGTNVSTPNTTSFCNATSNGTTIISDALPFDSSANTLKNNLAKAILSGLNLQVVSGTGQFAANTKITSFTSNTQYTINNIPTVALSNACIKFVGGGISGNNVQPNSITYNNLANSAGGVEELGASVFIISQGNTTTAPVDITGLASPAPYYIDGTTVGANYYYPFYQNTATTANGYSANSTGQFTPAGATDWVRNNGDSSWWIHNYVFFSGGNVVNTNENLVLDCDSQFVANANTTIQISPMITIANSGGYFGDDQFTYTLELTANQPLRWSDESLYAGTSTIDGAGYMIRNMVANTRVYCTWSQQIVSKKKV